jgi:sec-independent protein translocase protein TatC
MTETISSKKSRGRQNDPQLPKKDHKEMSFWDHLRELRSHIMKSLTAILLFAIIAFIYKDIIFNDIILAPKSAQFITNIWFCEFGKILNIEFFCVPEFSLQLINISMAGQFMTHMYISFMFGLILSAPYIIYQFWKFVEPALYEHERRNTGITVLVSSSLFIGGILFSYYLIVPLALNFFGTYQVSESVANQISLSSYISTVVSVTFSVGLVFEMPIVIFYLAKAGLVSTDFLKKNRKYTLVIVVILAAIVTPPDVFSQILVAVPLMLLYESSIWMAQKALKKKAAETDSIMS